MKTRISFSQTVAFLFMLQFLAHSSLAWNPGFGPGFGKRRPEYDVRSPSSSREDSDTYSGPSAAEVRARRATDLNNQAVALANKGDNEAALRLYYQSLRLNPNDSVIRKNIAITLTKLGMKASYDGDHRLAVQRFEEALTYDPNNKDIGEHLRYSKERLSDKDRLSDVKATLDRMLDQFSAELSGQRSLGVLGGQSLRQAGGTPSGLGDSSVVDLTFLDPSKPIVVDPHVVRGEPRRFPVQGPGTCTPKGENYDKGFEELKKGNPAAAIEFFKQAEAENPDNPAVRNAKDLANDLLKVRQDAARSQAERETFTNARLSFIDGTEALRKGDVASAGDMFYRASNTNPFDKDLMNTTKTMGMYLYWAKKGKPTSTATEDEKKLYTAVAEHSSVATTAMILKDYDRALNELEAAEILFADQCRDEEIQKAVGKYDPSSEAVRNRAMMRSGINSAMREMGRLRDNQAKASNP